MENEVKEPSSVTHESPRPAPECPEHLSFEEAFDRIGTRKNIWPEGVRSLCCSAPVVYSYGDGLFCTKCKKWCAGK